MSFISQPFMQHAFLAGSGIALASGLVGYFVVLRAQVFTGDALSHVAFTGALAALAAGLDARVGLFALAIAVGLLMGAIGPKAARTMRSSAVCSPGYWAWESFSSPSTLPHGARGPAVPASLCSSGHPGV